MMIHENSRVKFALRQSSDWYCTYEPACDTHEDWKALRIPLRWLRIMSRQTRTFLRMAKVILAGPAKTVGQSGMRFRPCKCEQSASTLHCSILMPFLSKKKAAFVNNRHICEWLQLWDEHFRVARLFALIWSRV
jgi:hypothetical protein